MPITHASPHFRKGFSINCGYSFSRQDEKVLQYTNPFSPSSLNAAYLGLNYQVDLTQRLALTTGVQLSERGLRVAYEVTNYNTASPVLIRTRYSYRLSYAELPIGLSWYRPRAAWQVQVVPSYLLDASFLFTESYHDTKTKIPYAYSPFYNNAVRLVPQFNTFDLGLRVGVCKPVCSFLDLEVMAQKNVLRSLKYRSDEINYSQSLFVGLRYYVGARPQKKSRSRGPAPTG